MLSRMTSLAVLGAACVILAAPALTGCGGGGSGTTGCTTNCTPPGSMTVKGVKFAQYNRNYQLTVAITGGSSSGYSCSSPDANKATITDAATCKYKAGTTSGVVKIHVAPTDSTITAQDFSVQVGNYGLYESLGNGAQYIDVNDSAAPAVTAFDGGTIRSKGVTVPVPSSDGTEIVSMVNTSGTTGGIFQTDGSTTTEVGSDINLAAAISPTSGANNPNFCPDGNTIIYTAYLTTDVQVWKYDATTKKFAPVVSAGNTSKELPPPHCMLNGKVSYQSQTDHTVHEVNLDGTGDHQLVKEPSAVAFVDADETIVIWSNGLDTFVEGSADPLYPGKVVYGLFADGKTITMMDPGSGTTAYYGNDKGESAVMVGTAGKGIWTAPLN